MTRKLLIVFFLLATLGLWAQPTNTNEKPLVVPEVTSWTGGTGQVALSGRYVLVTKSMAGVAATFARDYKQMTGRTMTLRKGPARQGDIVFISRKHDTMSLEGYQLTIGRPTKKRNGTAVVEISSPSERGAFWATRTLLQLVSPTSASLPCGQIVDEPQYRLRGFVFDVGRKYIPMDYLRRLVRLMGYYKMNTLHLHLNDNGFKKYFDEDWLKTQAAFRLECDTYPGLTAKDGSYTKAEFIALQELASRNGVEIIPEIDAPAHSLAFTHYRPDLASKEYGMDHLDLSNPDVYTFMDALFREYLSPAADQQPVFRGPRVCIGTDEYSNARQEVVEQFRAYTDHYLALVESFGKQPTLWGALTHARGETPVRHEGVLMNCWYNGYAQPDSMRQLGYQLVSIPDGLVYIVPKAGYYYDYLNCEYLYNNWTPATIGDKRFEEQDPQIEGGMFALWNDIPDPTITIDDLHDRIVPALQTIAAKTWTGRLVTLPYEEFEKYCKTLKR
ncbi:MAG: family 20 glycosylhydrolase [Prevotella sp.]|nr:family 20 glycosylhydrolase [Prevotella sp.]